MQFLSHTSTDVLEHAKGHGQKIFTKCKKNCDVRDIREWLVNGVATFLPSAWMISWIGTYPSLMGKVEYTVHIEVAALSLLSRTSPVDVSPSVTKDSTALIESTMKNKAAIMLFTPFTNVGVTKPLYKNSSAPWVTRDSIPLEAMWYLIAYSIWSFTLPSLVIKQIVVLWSSAERWWKMTGNRIRLFMCQVYRSVDLVLSFPR